MAHLGSVSNVRAIWEHHSTRRVTDFFGDVPSSYARTEVASLLYGWRPSSVGGFCLGAMRSQTTGTVAPTGQSVEIFVKFDGSFRF